ncbi:MAG: Methyltransferase type 11 [Parcubacteria group bacterium]|nr:Methyltransferase type 11 [Parcubacteria group bacterium]
MDAFGTYYNTMEYTYGMSSSRKAKIFALLGDVSGKRILDVGCAGGYFGEEVKKKGDCEFIGIDISEKSVAEAKTKIDGAFVVDIQSEKTNFPNDHFDAIIFSEVIEHLLFPEKALEELKRIMKKDGVLIITTPNLLVFSNRVRMLFGKFEYKDFTYFERGHIHFFTVASLRKLLKEEGFMIDATDNLIHPKVPVWLGNIFPNLFAYQAIVRVKKIS